MGKNKQKEKDKKPKKDKKRAKKEKAAAKTTAVTSKEQRLDMIAMAAYFIAEKHGFDPGHATQDWAEAEKQIDDMLMAKESK